MYFFKKEYIINLQHTKVRRYNLSLLFNYIFLTFVIDLTRRNLK